MFGAHIFVCNHCTPYYNKNNVKPVKLVRVMLFVVERQRRTTMMAMTEYTQQVVVIQDSVCAPRQSHTSNIQLAKPTTGYWIEKSDVRFLPCFLRPMSTMSTSRSDVVALTHIYRQTWDVLRFLGCWDNGQLGQYLISMVFQWLMVMMSLAHQVTFVYTRWS